MKITKEKEYKILQHYINGLKITEIAKIEQTSISTVFRYLQKNNVEIRRINKLEAITLYNSGLSVKKISTKLNCSATRILEILKQYNIQIRHGVDYKGQNKRVEIWNKKEEILLLYFKERQTLKEIAKKYNVSSSFIGRIIRESGYSTRLPAKTKREVTERLFDVQEACNLYIQGHTADSLSKRYNINKNVIYKRLRDCGVNIHGTTSLSNSLKVKNSFKCKPYILPSGATIFIQGYEPAFLDFVFKQRLLTEQDIVFRPPTFIYTDSGSNRRKYFPDFYIPKFNLIIEVKSEWILKKQTHENFEKKKMSVIDNGYNFLCVKDNNFDELLKILRPVC